MGMTRTTEIIEIEQQKSHNPNRSGGERAEQTTCPHKMKSHNKFFLSLFVGLWRHLCSEMHRSVFDTLTVAFFPARVFVFMFSIFILSFVGSRCVFNPWCGASLSSIVPHNDILL